MLSNEARPVEMIATDERGCPRWVMCHWTDIAPEKMLLLHHSPDRAAYCYRTVQPDSRLSRR